jgi:hypothetical protein
MTAWDPCNIDLPSYSTSEKAKINCKRGDKVFYDANLGGWYIVKKKTGWFPWRIILW